MYNILLGICLCASSVFCCSCNSYLDREIDSYINKNMTFSSYERTNQYLVSIYAIIPDGLDRMGSGGMFDAATDDAEQALETSNVQKFNTGSWNAVSNPDDMWNRLYSGIRMANEFLENADGVNLDTYKNDPSNQTEYQNRLKDIRIWKAEAQFLRAYFYFELLKRYGPVPIITTPLSINGDYGNTERPSMEECVDFISKDCDEAASILEITPWRDNTALGHATKGAALALKSRLLLYAASPLYQDWTNTSEESLPSNIAKWTEAAAAAKAVIDLGQYSLTPFYTDLFTNNFQSSEFIFMKRYSANTSLESYNFPISFGGQGGTNPSQNLVDAYEMNDGTTFSWDNASQAANPYKDRDARLNATVIVNGSQWKQNTVDIWTGGKDGAYTTNATKTGYYLKKFSNESVNILTGGGALGHTWPIFRLAEIYLNYAEALNESAPGNPDIAEYVNNVRARADQPDLPEGLTQEQMRERIRRERRIELAFEEHRAWDVRRWKIASSTLGTVLRGVNITKEGDVAVRYLPYTVEQRTFLPKMYWYPIPQSELLKLPSWKQNPGW
nr:RagB/SusD family nutrient uptake outer membrane protein [Prevotella sp. KH2C16]